jgi:hypothetical protein
MPRHWEAGTETGSENSRRINGRAGGWTPEGAVRHSLAGPLGNLARRPDAIGFQSAATARSSLAQAGDRCLHRQVGRREENRDLAAGQHRSQLCARLTEEFAVNHGDRRKDRIC